MTPALECDNLSSSVRKSAGKTTARNVLDSVKVIRNRSELEAFAADWNRLLEKSAQKNVFLTWEWVSNWVDVYIEENALLTLIVFDEGEPVAIAPLHVQTERPIRGVNLRVLRFVGSGEVCADHVDMIFAGDRSVDRAKVIWDHLFGPLRGEWDVFEYYDAPSDSPSREAFREFASRDRRCMKAELVGQSVCPYLALPGSWNEFLSQCSGTRRYAINYSMKKLAEQGRLEKRICENAEELAGQMETFISLHQESWNERGKPGSFSSDRFKRFHLRVANDFLRKGILFLCSFHLDGTHIASFYGFEYDRRLYYYLLGVKLNPVKRVKTGTAVLGHCIQEAIRRGCREFDFLRGSEEYKYRWTLTDRRNPNMRFYNRTSKAFVFLVCRFSYVYARRLFKTVFRKRFEFLKPAVGSNSR